MDDGHTSVIFHGWHRDPPSNRRRATCISNSVFAVRSGVGHPYAHRDVGWLANSPHAPVAAALGSKHAPLWRELCLVFRDRRPPVGECIRDRVHGADLGGSVGRRNPSRGAELDQSRDNWCRLSWSINYSTAGVWVVQRSITGSASERPGVRMRSYYDEGFNAKQLGAEGPFLDGPYAIPYDA